MLRLRTSTALSALALAIGVAGTNWLSTLTSQWPGRAARGVAVVRRATVPLHQRPARHRHVPASILSQRRRAVLLPIVVVSSGEPAAATVTPGVDLLPLAMPSDNSVPWYRLKGHLDGRVVMHLRVDGRGRVITASVGQSSGDELLDDHALRSVRLWRFVVPPDGSGGFSGDLRMRFASGAGDLVSAM